VNIVRDLIAAGKLGDLLELRGHGKEDQRGGGEDMMVLGTHTFDLMRFLAGDARWCFARISQNGRKATAADVKPGGEGMGPIVGDQITAKFGFDGLPVGSFYTHKAKHNPSARYWVEVCGSKGLVHLGYGAFPPVYFCDDPTWMPGQSKKPWQPITSAGLNQPEPLNAKEIGNGNAWIAEDLIRAVEEDRQPLGSIYDGRAALEMILAVYESHRQDRPVDLPLKNRKHPLADPR
jgi:predicted dehydrogenase